MAKIYLVTGGCRSGKSDYSLELAGSLPGTRAFVATCPVLDDEMRARVERHRLARQGKGWATIEESLDLAGAIKNAACDLLLVDCLTLWVNNLMYRAQQNNAKIEEDDIAKLTDEVLSACRGKNGHVIFVTNEVGMGIVPADAATRLYRDLVGRCNRTIAAVADSVTLVTCGIPQKIK